MRRGLGAKKASRERRIGGRIAMSGPYEELERVFHEPNRLAIVTELSGHISGVVFSELRDSCGLTDGNLSRHLAALEKAGVVKIEKSFVGAKPRTRLHNP